ncbi:hypothetical protein Taro_044245, partial [Colocasia esculenta]|nr:hypothetical protein [Colocasia esculenta]
MWFNPLVKIGCLHSRAAFPLGFSLSLALFSRPLLPHYFQWLQKASWRIVECEVVTNRPRKRRSEGWEYLRYQPRVSVKLIAEDLGKFEMADRRDWGGGGDDLEESTQRMIERIWESLTDIRRRMDQQAPVPPIATPPGDGEIVPIIPVPPPPGAEVPFVAPLPPPPVLVAEEPVMQVEKFLRLQLPTYSGGPNPDTTE